MQDKKPLKKVGAIWLKTSAAGNKFISMDVSKVDPDLKTAVAFKNKKKAPDNNYPDFEIFQEDIELVQNLEKIHADNIVPTVNRVNPATAIKASVMKHNPVKPIEDELFDEGNAPY